MVQGYVRYKGRDFYLIRKPIQLGISSHASITTLSNTDYIGRAIFFHGIHFSAGGGTSKGRRGKQPRYALGTRPNGCPSEQNVGMDKKVGVLTIILLFLYPVVLKAFDCD